MVFLDRVVFPKGSFLTCFTVYAAGISANIRVFHGVNYTEHQTCERAFITMEGINLWDGTLVRKNTLQHLKMVKELTSPIIKVI